MIDGPMFFLAYGAAVGGALGWCAGKRRAAGRYRQEYAQLVDLLHAHRDDYESARLQRLAYDEAYDAHHPEEWADYLGRVRRTGLL